MARTKFFHSLHIPLFWTDREDLLKGCIRKGLGDYVKNEYIQYLSKFWLTKFSEYNFRSRKTAGEVYNVKE